MDWITNISKALTYIENHLEQNIVYEEIAKVANCSTYYFQRIFSYVTGISLAEYVRRRRMTQAAFDLQRTESKVIDIALKYGYSSPTAFNRAFKSVHNISPINAKKKGATLNSFPAIEFSINVKGGNAMSYRIEEKPAIQIVGLKTPMVEDMEGNHEIIPKFWNSLKDTKDFDEICSFSDSEPNGILGVSVFDEQQGIYYYIAASTKQKVAGKFSTYEIPASTWVIFENNGYLKESVQNVFRRFYTEWLLGSGYQYAGLPDIEVYPILKDKILKGKTEVWIAIKKRESND